MENLQNLLLEEIYLRYGSRTGTSLNAFIIKLGRLPSDLEFTIDLKTIIQNLENTGIVTWTANTIKDPAFDPNKFKRELGTIDEKGNGLTFDNIYVEVHLTHDKGLDYAGNIVNRELVRKSTIETNTSIQTLNTQTDTFYQKQKTYNNVQIGFTIAIVLATIVSATVATCDYADSKNCDKQKYTDTLNHKQKVLQIEEKLKKLIDEDSTFHKEIKDSLKSISERIKTKH